MNVFLSWSGKRSRHLADSLKELLPRHIQELEPFISADIEPGANWFNEISKALSNSDGVGIFVVTRENISAPWLNFEAGVIAAWGDTARVCCLLLDIDAGEVPYPLQAFNLLPANAEGAPKLFKMLNGRLEKQLNSDVLEFATQGFRPLFVKAIEDAKNSDATPHQIDRPNTNIQLEKLTASLSRVENSLATQGAMLEQVAAALPQLALGKGGPGTATNVNGPLSEMVNRNIVTRTNSVAMDFGLAASDFHRNTRRRIRSLMDDITHFAPDGSDTERLERSLRMLERIIAESPAFQTVAILDAMRAAETELARRKAAR